MNSTLLGNRSFTDVIKMSLYWIRVGPKSNITDVLVRKTNLDTDTQTHRGRYAKTETENGEIQLKVK
jgi:hypothetical protein